MPDPLADPRAAELLAAIPDDVATVAASFRAAADRASMTGAGLAAAQHDATWTGAAADRFRTSIGRLPGELQHVRAGYSAVADALDAYEPELARVRAAFVRTAAELTDARARARTEHDRAEMGSLTRRADALLEEFAALRGICRSAIASAQASAPVRPRVP